MKSRLRRYLVMLLVLMISFTSIPCLPAAVLKAGTEDSDNIFEGEDFKAEFILLNNDNGNYQAKIKITNTKSSTIQNWALQMEFNSDIATIEQASILKQESNVYYIKGLNRNRNIASGETVEFKISGTSSFVISPSHYSMIEFQNFVNDLDYMISYQLENSWDSGYQGKIIITNNRETPIKGWSLEFDFDGEITQAFTCVISSHDGDHYTILNSGYNEDINSGETLELGFLGSGNCLNTPKGYVLWEKANSENESTREPTTEPVLSQEPVLSEEPAIVPTTEPEPANSEQVTESPVISPSPAEEIPSVTPVFSSEEPVPSSGTDIPDEYKESVLYPILIYQGKTEEEIDINADYDGDGLSNLSEYENGTDSGIADSDGDGLDDYKEIYTYNTDPLVYDTDKDGLGDGTEIANVMNPLEKDTNGDGVLDGDEKIKDQVLTDEVYSELDCESMGVMPQISVSGTGDYSSKIRLECETYENTNQDMEGFVSPVIDIEHPDDMEYDSATISFSLSDTIVQNHSVSALSVVRLEDGNIVPIDTNVSYSGSTYTLSASVDKLCRYAVIDKDYDNRLIISDGYIEAVFVIDTLPTLFISDDVMKHLKESMHSMLEQLTASGMKYRFGLIEYGEGSLSERHPYCINHGWFDTSGEFASALDSLSYRDAYSTKYYNLNYKSAMEEAVKMLTPGKLKSMIFHLTDDCIDRYYEKDDVADQFFTDCKAKRISVVQCICNDRYDAFACERYGAVYGYNKIGFKINAHLVSEGQIPVGVYFSFKENDVAEEFEELFACLKRDFYSDIILLSNENTGNSSGGEESSTGRQQKNQIQWIRLTNSQFVYVSTDPAEDSDGDGIPDQTELAEQVSVIIDGCGKEIPVYAYRSNPNVADTDGDGISDDKDPQPKDYDVTIASYDDSGIVRLNTGKSFQILFSKQYPVEQFLKEYYCRTISLHKASLEMTYSDLRSAILMDFSMDELECISLIDEGMMRFLVENKSTMYKCQIFEHLTGKMVADVQTGEPQLGSVEGNYDFVLKNDVLSYFKLTTYKKTWTSYYHAMFEQILLGRYAKSENTGLGLIGEIGVAFTGLDAAQDIRDLLYDATHWECSWEHVVDTALNAVSILPVVGAVGHLDEVVMFIKRTDNLFEIRRVAKIGEDIIDTVKRTTNALENLVDSADLAIRRMGQNSYSCLLEALDIVKQGGKMQLCTEYGTDFSKAFAELGDDAENLALTHPSAVQKAYRETIEGCTDSSGKVTDTVEKIEEKGKKDLKLAEDLAQHADEELNAVARKYSDDVMSYKFVGETYVPVSDKEYGSYYEKYIRLANEMYESYRNSTDDIQKIAANTNWDISDVQKVKDYMFLTEVRLDNKVALLDPDYEMAVAWSRLIKGQYYNSDILLLKHELYESTYYKLYDCKQREAHNFTCKLFDWYAKLRLLIEKE